MTTTPDDDEYSRYYPSPDSPTAPPTEEDDEYVRYYPQETWHA